MIRKLSYLLVITLISLSACTDTPNKSKSNTETDALEKTLSRSKTENAQAQQYACFERQTHEGKFSCLYERFNYESALCSKLDKLVRDKGLMQKLKKDFYSPQIGGSNALTMLLNGPLHEDPDVNYILKHPEYIEIDVDYHYEPQGAIYIAGTDIYCAPTLKRLQELESLGQSDVVWQAREKWLNHALKNINWPWSEMGGPEEYFFTEFEYVKKVYKSDKDKEHLLSFIDKAEKYFFQTAESQDIEGSAGKTKKQHLEILHQWIEQMRRGI